VTRAEVEAVRGVEVDAVIRSLLERQLVRVAGHREVPGRPMLYATTRRFLEVFGLDKLDDLPTLREMEELLAPPDQNASGPPPPLASRIELVEADEVEASEAEPSAELH
jgi:segregation and condensation protein B